MKITGDLARALNPIRKQLWVEGKGYVADSRDACDFIQGWYVAIVSRERLFGNLIQGW